MAQLSDPPKGPGPAADLHAAGVQKASRWAARLLVALPALFALVIMGYGGIVIAAISVFRKDNEWAEVMWIAVTALPVFAIIAIAAGLGAAYTIVVPLQKLSDALDRISAGVGIDSPLEISGAPEVKAVGVKFNSLMHYLHGVFNERNRFLTEASNVGAMTVNMEGRVSSMNSAAAEILGLIPSTLLGQEVGELFLSLSGNPQAGPFLQMVEQAVRGDRSFPARAVLVGGERGDRRLSVTLTLERGADAAPSSYLFSFRDVSEGELMRRKLEQTDKLATMGAFSMGLAHELRNPLGAIKGMAQLLEEYNAAEESSRNFAHKIVEEVDRMDTFVRELLQFGQEAPTPPAPTNINRIASDAIDLARGGSAEWLDDKQLRIETRLSDTPNLLAQGDRLTRALANIIANAFEAAPPGARVTIETGVALREEAEYVRAIVENEGDPIPAEFQQKIFEPFFTTKARGTGLGLAIAYQSVLQNGGDLTVRSGDRTTHFEMWLPLD